MRLFRVTFQDYQTLAKLDEVDEVPHMMVDKTGIGSPKTKKAGDHTQSTVSSQDETEQERMAEVPSNKVEPETMGYIYGRKEDLVATSDKSPAGSRTKSNQRWMKLRTTVQLSGAISNTIQKSKPPLKREDSFLKRFSTRQIPETQETVETGDETEPANGIHSQEEVNRRRRKRRKEQSKTVVNPDENFYFYWLMTVTVCVLYNLWTLIVRQSFPELQKDKRAFWYGCDTFTDIVFVCDIVIQFRTGYLEQGLMVYDSKKLAKHYLKSRAFVLDLITLLPLDLLQMEIGINPILRLPRFFKIYRVYSYYYIVESRTVYPNLWRVVNLIHILLILAHWFGCFYYLLSEAEGFQGAWVYPYQQGDDATLTRKYLGSLYWSTLTLTTIGDLPTPETNADNKANLTFNYVGSRSRGCSKAMTCQNSWHPLRRRGHKSRLLQINSNYGYIFTIVSYLIGVFIFATIVGQVGNVITNRNANRLEFERLLDGAKTYMRHHKVPGGMKRRVLRWYDYSWSRGRIQGGGDINTALGLLPDKLKTELALHVNLSVLKKVTIFQECQPEFLHDLVLKMKAYIFTPGDLICRKGEIAREMFIIADGILDVISETGRVLTTMKAGDFFGEIGILNLDGLNKRTADVRSVGYSELFSLSREDVLAAMKDYPEAQEILQNLGRKRLMEAKNASKISKSQGKTTREQGSPGDIDNAGKGIVEKLRSDVKGLKNALRKSRRETRDYDDDADGYREGFSCRANEKRHSILRRMSHVQSSDEYEVLNEGQMPIGVGLPLLQRLKLLKEKQEKEKEERNKCLKKNFSRRENSVELEDCVPATQRLVSVKEKEDSDEISSGEIVVSPSSAGATDGVSTLHGQPFPRVETAYPSKSDSIKLGEKSEHADKNQRAVIVSEQSFKNGFCSDEPQKNAQHPEMPKNSRKCNQELINQETSIYVPKVNGNIVNSVPKQALGITLELPKYKERWSVLRKSTGSKGEEMKKEGGYSLKDNNLVEKCEGEESSTKRSRSISPSDDAKNRKRTLRSAVENLIRERRRSRSLNLVDQKSRQNVKQWNESKTGIDSSGGIMMKKYNSIDDLSPEYSGLPFVKKLKILNERQKLAELVEKELGVRSVSLDVPDSMQEGSLFRSRSLASTMDFPSERRRTWQKNCENREDQPLSFQGRRSIKPEDSFRAAMLDMKQRFISMGSSGSLQSPESNETVERRHLKSILKKLSADNNNGDEDQHSRNRRRRISLSRGGQIDLKNLMRAPTVEGYAARHTKLTKSVTFDSETLPSPTEVITVKAAGLEETIGKGLSPSSPTALLTLHLSNLSVIPIASPKKSEKKIDDATNIARYPVEILAEIYEELDKAFAANTLGILPYEKVVTELGRIIRVHMEAINENYQSQLQDFQIQLKKRDELIYKLRVKIKELEGFAFGEESCKFKSSVRSRGCSPTSMAEFVSTRKDSSKNSFRLSEKKDNSPMNSLATCYKQKSHASNEAEIDMTIFDRTEESIKSEAFEEIEPNELTSKAAGTMSIRRKGGNCRRASADMTAEKKGESGGVINRVTGFRKSLSGSGDFIAVEIESSNSSDLEEFRNYDWEVRMLAEELSKNEWTTKQLKKIRKLEDDVNELKKVVCERNLTRFTASELDLLETILESKDQKISEIASSSCFDIADRRKTRDEIAQIAGRDRPSHPSKIGHAFSFDFHDMENQNRPSLSPRKSISLRKQKSTARPYRERQGLETLLNASRFWKFRVLENSRNKMYLSKERGRYSFPLIQSKLTNQKFRTSLPTLSNRGFERVNECLTYSVSSSDEANQESCDSISENQVAPPSKKRFSGSVISSFVKEVEQNSGKYVAGQRRNGGRRELAPEKKNEIVKENFEREETEEQETKENNRG